MNAKQTWAVLLVGLCLLAALILFIQVRGLDEQYDDPCANQPITECEAK